MATRDVTKPFIEIRQAAKLKRQQERPPVPAEGATPSDGSLLDNAEKGTDWVAARHQLPPKWVDVVNKIEELVKRITTKQKELSALHRKRLLVSFDDSAEATQENEIEQVTSTITGLFREADKVTSALTKQSGEESDSELRVRRSVQRSLAFKLQSLSNGFRSQQKEYLTKLRLQKEGGGTGGAALDAILGKKDAPMVETDAGFTQRQMEMVDNMEALVNERDTEIQRIAESIEELANIMKHLAGLVIDQGTILDRIDYNMDAAVEHTKEGVAQLVEAEKIQKDGNPIKCIVALLLLIFILVIVMIAKHSPRRRK